VKLLKMILVITCVLLIQTMLLARYGWSQYLDLFLLLNVYYALNFSQLSSLGMAIFCGIVQDSFSEGILGMNAFSKTIVVYFISTVSARLMIKHPLFIIFLISISTAIDTLVISGLHRVFSLPQPGLSPQAVLIAIGVNSFTGVIGFQMADKIRLRKEYA
jgi:rod shape-determining protein MreD